MAHDFIKDCHNPKAVETIRARMEELYVEGKFIDYSIRTTPADFAEDNVPANPWEIDFHLKYTHPEGSGEVFIGCYDCCPRKTSIPDDFLAVYNKD